MTKSQLVKLLHAQKPNLNLEEIEKIIDIIFETMAEALSNGQRIEIRKFGCFSLRKRAARNNARDPRNGKTITVEDRWVPYFRQGKVFFNKINNS